MGLTNEGTIIKLIFEVLHTHSHKVSEMKKRYVVLAIVLVFIAFIVYEFLFGMLFPYSPVIVGFTKHELPHSVIYVQNGAGYSDFSAIDTLVPLVEQFHELRFT
jgi:hypothetical protein